MSQSLCIECGTPVRPRQQGLQCDGCQNWQHPTCNTGVSQQQYRTAVQPGEGIDWHCTQCSISLHAPIVESHAIACRLCNCHHQGLGFLKQPLVPNQPLVANQPLVPNQRLVPILVASKSQPAWMRSPWRMPSHPAT